MNKLLGLSKMANSTQFAPLAGLGYHLIRQDFFAPLREQVHLPIKTIKHKPHEKLIDCIVSILAGCKSISAIDTHIRPDIALARAWGRERFAQQSTVADTLDAFDEETVSQLRSAINTIFLERSQVLKHDFEKEMLVLDLDLTGLLASKNAQKSEKGCFSGKKTAMVGK